jgi:hypothetical protein
MQLATGRELHLKKLVDHLGFTKVGTKTEVENHVVEVIHGLQAAKWQTY